jgi:crossover junction endodeoxyribonuclease RusA
VTFTVLGRPVPAVRMTQRGKFVSPGRARDRFKAQARMRHLAHRNLIAWTARQRRVPLAEGPVRLRVAFYLRPARGRVPDLSNLVKLVEDALNGMAWRDDRQIVELVARRHIVKPGSDEWTDIDIEEVPQ